MNEIKIWAQMFFDDGSVSQGVRIPVETLDDDRLIQSTAEGLLRPLKRDYGLLVIWGAGNLVSLRISIFSSLEHSVNQCPEIPELQ